MVSKMPRDLVTCLSTASLSHNGVPQAGAQMAWQCYGAAAGAGAPKAGLQIFCHSLIQVGRERCLLQKQCRHSAVLAAASLPAGLAGAKVFRQQRAHATA